MAIEFTCPKCQTVIRVPDEAGGKKGTCPGCKSKLRVPQVEKPYSPATPDPTQTASASPAPVPEQSVVVPPPIAPDVGPPAVEPPPVIPSPEGAVPENVDATAATPSVTWPGEEPPAAPSHPPQSAVQEPVTSQSQPVLHDPLTIAPPEQPASSVERPLEVTSGSMTASVRRRSKRKMSGLWFVVICGAGLVGGVGWLYMQGGPKLEGTRVAFRLTGVALKPKMIERREIEVSKEVLDTVLGHFEEDPQRLDSRLVETEFRGAPTGLEIRIRPGDATQFFQFPVDADLRGWADGNAVELDKARSAMLSKSLTELFEQWDIAIRNQTGVENFASFRDRVGLNGCVGGLGANISAQVGDQLYPCVYEEDNALYFLLPRSTKSFQVVGRFTNGKKSLFPGKYQVTSKAKQEKKAKNETPES